MSILSQLRPAESEKYDRRWGKRKYDPNYNLCRHINLPSVEEMKNPVPPPFKMDYPDPKLKNRTYRTSYGVLTPAVMDQFARHHQWKTASQEAYVNYYPKQKPPVAPCIHHRADMTKNLWPGKSDENGPYEYQEYRIRNGLLPEDKVWPNMDHQYKRFPNIGGEGRRDPFRYVRDDPTRRTEEQTEQIRDHIRDLVKNNDLNIQFVKPPDHYTGRQEQVRSSEGLEKTPGRNPAWATTEHMAQFGRRIPAEEYKKPEHGGERLLSSSEVLQTPCNYLKASAEQESTLAYLPTPWTYTKRPTDLRLISGYRL